MREYFSHSCVDEPHLTCSACEFSQHPQTFSLFIDGVFSKVTLEHGVVTKATPGARDLVGKNLELVDAWVRCHSGWCEWEGQTPVQAPAPRRPFWLRLLWPTI